MNPIIHLRIAGVCFERDNIGFELAEPSVDPIKSIVVSFSQSFCCFKRLILCDASVPRKESKRVALPHANALSRWSQLINSTFASVCVELSPAVILL
jgi:hypothetical protein